MSHIKSWLILIAVVGLQSCGFVPLHQHQTDYHSPSSFNIKIVPIADREGQILHNYLLDKLNPYGRSQVPDYILKTTYTINTSEFGFRRDATPKRINTNIVVSFSLISSNNNAVIYTDRVDVNMGFSVGAQSATASLPQVVSEEDAIKRIMEQAASEIQLLIISYLHRLHAPENNNRSL